MYCIPEKEISLAAYKDTYATLQEQYPEWTPHDLRVQTAKDLLPKFLTDQETARRENLGLPVNDVPEAAFTLTSAGSVWYPNYGSGVGLIELSERSKKLMPEKYSPEEHATSLLIESQFQNGATRVATSYGGRDIVIMEYDPKTHEGKTTVLNTAVLLEAQNKTIKEFMQGYFPQLASVFVTDNVFLFSDKKVTVARAKEIVRPVLKDVMMTTKRQFVHSYAQEYQWRQEQDGIYMPLPFLSFQSVDHKDVMLKQAVSKNHTTTFEEKRKDDHPLLAVFEPRGIHTDVADEEQKTAKEVVLVEEQHTQPQKAVREEIVVFQYKEGDEIVTEQKQKTSSLPVIASNEQEMTMVSLDGTVSGQVPQEIVAAQESSIGALQPTAREQQMTVSTSVAELPQQQEEVEQIDVRAFQHEEYDTDVVVSETIEEYFKHCDKAEAVVEMQSQDVRILYRAPTQEQSVVEEQEPKEIKIVRKLCWLVPLTITTEQPEMFEVEMPKDQNQRLYNLLHFLRKVIQHQFGEDTIHSRQTQAIQTDRQETFFDEIEYYLSLLEQKNMRSHMFALVS